MTEERDIDLGLAANRVGRIARSAKVGVGSSPEVVGAARLGRARSTTVLSYFGGEVEDPFVLVQAQMNALARNCAFEVVISRHGTQLHTRSYYHIREALYYATLVSLLSGIRTLVVDVRSADAQVLAGETERIVGGREQRCLERELRVGPSYEGGIIAWRVRVLGDPERTAGVLEGLQRAYGIDEDAGIFEEVTHG